MVSVYKNHVPTPEFVRNASLKGIDLRSLRSHVTCFQRVISRKRERDASMAAESDIDDRLIIQSGHLLSFSGSESCISFHFHICIGYLSFYNQCATLRIIIINISARNGLICRLFIQYELNNLIS